LCTLSTRAPKDPKHLDLRGGGAGRRVGDRPIREGAKVLVTAAEHVRRHLQRPRDLGAAPHRQPRAGVQQLKPHLAARRVLGQVAGRARLFPGQQQLSLAVRGQVPGAKASRPDLPLVCASFLQTATNFLAAPSQTTRSNPLWLQPQSKPLACKAPPELTTFMRSPWWMFTPVVSVLDLTQAWPGTVI